MPSRSAVLLGLALAGTVASALASPHAAAEPLFDARAERRARLRLMAFADIATVPAVGEGEGGLVSGAGLGLLVSDRRLELGLAFRDTRAAEREEDDQGLCLFGGFYYALDPAERIALHLRGEAGAAVHGTLLRAQAGLAFTVGPLMFTLDGGVMMTSLNAFDDPVPLVALGLLVAP